MNRTVAVTGGSGKLGRAVVAALIVEGWTVVNFDRVPHRTAEPTSYARDLTDCGQVVEALSGIDEVHSGVNAVIHLAAIPGATFAPNVATFDNNLVSTFHISRPPNCSRFTIWSGPPARRCLATRLDGAVDPRCAADRIRLAQGRNDASGGRLPSRRAGLPRRWCFH